MMHYYSTETLNTQLLHLGNPSLIHRLCEKHVQLKDFNRINNPEEQITHLFLSFLKRHSPILCIDD